MNEKYLEFAKKIAYKAGEIMLKYYNSKNGSTYKYDQTIVTKADIEINDYLIKKVREEFPNHSVDGEEKSFGKSECVWVCDPVDGTAMYSRHIPVSVFSLALVKNGIPEIGVIYDPFSDNLYSAIKDQGAFRNDEKIQVNDYDLDDIRSLAQFDINSKFEYHIHDAIKELEKKSYFVSIGSICRACVCIANGDFTLAIYPGTIHKNCDIAAAKVIVEEAGGKVTDLFGKDQKYDDSINGAIISNKKVHPEVVSVIKKYLNNKY